MVTCWDCQLRLQGKRISRNLWFIPVLYMMCIRHFYMFSGIGTPLDLFTVFLAPTAETLILAGMSYNLGLGQGYWHTSSGQSEALPCLPLIGRCSSPLSQPHLQHSPNSVAQSAVSRIGFFADLCCWRKKIIPLVWTYLSIINNTHNTLTRPHTIWTEDTLSKACQEWLEKHLFRLPLSKWGICWRSAHKLTQMGSVSTWNLGIPTPFQSHRFEAAKKQLCMT